jgi:amidase
MSRLELWRLDAAELAPMIAAGTVSCQEAVQSCLDRMDAINPYLNAVVRPLHQAALARAEAADAAQRRGEPLGALHGVPITIKVSTDMQGEASDNSVIAFKDVIAAEDAPVVSHLRRAGAVVIGRTNTPAFSMRWFTANDLHGETRNPWSPLVTPGGSSGGAASAVAAGIGPIAHGSDIAGSIRYPAYCCGVAGLRPSFGRVPSFNASATTSQGISAQLMAVQGPLARRVRDVRLAFNAMAHPDPRDPRVLPLGTFPPRPGPLRAAVIADPGGAGVHPAIATAVHQAGQTLRAAGYEIDDVEPPEFTRTARLWGPLGGPDAIARLLPLVEAHGDAGIKRGLAFWAAAWHERDPQICLDALAERHRLLRLWTMFLERYTVVVMPVSRALPYPPDEDIKDEATGIAIVRAQEPMLAVSVLGLPAASVPTGLHEGIPVGVQVVSAMGREDLCLDAAAIIEAHCPVATPIDPVR